MSEKVTSKIKAIKIAIPTVWIHLSTSGFTLLLVTASKIKKNSLPPSRAGKGRMLITAKFKDKSATKFKYGIKGDSVCKIEAVKLVIPTGPETDSETGPKFFIATEVEISLPKMFMEYTVRL